MEIVTGANQVSLTSQCRAVTVTSWSYHPHESQKEANCQVSGTWWDFLVLPQAALQQRLLSPAEHTYALCCSRFWPEKANTLSVSFQQLNLSFKGDYTLLRVGIFATKMSNLYYQLCNGVQQATFSD